MLRIVKLLAFLAVVGFIALTGYAYIADLSPLREDVVLPVDLEAL